SAPGACVQGSDWLAWTTRSVVREDPPPAPSRKREGDPSPRVEDEALPFVIHRHGLAVADLAREDARGDGVLEPLLDDALEGAGAVDRVVPLARDRLDRFGRERDRDLALREPGAEAFELDVHDARDLLAPELVE